MDFFDSVKQHSEKAVKDEIFRQKKAHIGLWARGLQLAVVQSGWQQANVRTARSRVLR